ncbi:hypothetical protein KCU88_g83, partial [Aureobasidium melanogenum]
MHSARGVSPVLLKYHTGDIELTMPIKDVERVHDHRGCGSLRMNNLKAGSTLFLPCRIPTESSPYTAFETMLGQVSQQLLLKECL